MVRLVVQHHDVLDAHQLRHDALEHLPLGFERLQLLAAPAFDRFACAFCDVHPLAQLEGVVIGDDDLGVIDVTEHVGRHDLAVAVIALGIVWQQYAQPVTDCDPRTRR